MLHRRELSLTGGGLAKLLIGIATLCLPFASSVPALAAPTSVSLTVTVRGDMAGKANAVEVTNTGGTLIGNCQNFSASVAQTCTITVPVNTGLLAVAQPAPGQAWKRFAGNGCQTAPGPVCHIQIVTSNASLMAAFGTAPAGPAISALTYKSPTPIPEGFGQSPTLAPYNFDKYALTVNGSGFPGSSPATLSDNGNVVATGVTDPNGVVSFTYYPQSEPQMYRKLVAGAAGQTATTDVYNTLIFYYIQYQTSAGVDHFVINETDTDNAADNFVQFGTNQKLALYQATTAPQGYAQVTTPEYICTPGATVPITFSGTRGKGTSGKFNYSVTQQVTCL